MCVLRMFLFTTILSPYKHNTQLFAIVKHYDTSLVVKFIKLIVVVVIQYHTDFFQCTIFECNEKE